MWSSKFRFALATSALFSIFSGGATATEHKGADVCLSDEQRGEILRRSVTAAAPAMMEAVMRTAGRMQQAGAASKLAAAELLQCESAGEGGVEVRCMAERASRDERVAVLEGIKAERKDDLAAARVRLVAVQAAIRAEYPACDK